MPEVEIDGKTVKFEDKHSHSIKHAIRFLEKNKGIREAVFNDARRSTNNPNRDAHFELEDNAENKNVAHHFTLIHHSDGKYELRKQHYDLF
jgi:hypothetical protein